MMRALRTQLRGYSTQSCALAGAWYSDGIGMGRGIGIQVEASAGERGRRRSRIVASVPDRARQRRAGMPAQGNPAVQAGAALGATFHDHASRPVGAAGT